MNLFSNYVKYARDFLFVGGAIFSIAFFFWPDGRRFLEKHVTNRTLAMHLGTYAPSLKNWADCKTPNGILQENPNFYHVSLVRKYTATPEVITALSGKIVVGTPKGIVPSREWPSENKDFSNQPVVGTVQDGACYHVWEVRPVSFTPSTPACPNISGNRISYWLKAVRVSCN